MNSPLGVPNSQVPLYYAAVGGTLPFTAVKDASRELEYGQTADDPCSLSGESSRGTGFLCNTRYSIKIYISLPEKAQILHPCPFLQ